MVNWKAYIPLIGGFPIGAQRVFGAPKDNSYVSFDDFESSDKLYENYIQGERNDDLSGLDLVVATAPCAGLSGASKAGFSDEAGNAHRRNMNRHIINSARNSVNAGVKLIIGETVPTFGSENPIAKDLRQELQNIADSRNYKFGYIKISSIDFGVPQNRKRIFYYLGEPDLVGHVEDKRQYIPDVKPEVVNLAQFLDKPARPGGDYYMEEFEESDREALRILLEAKARGDMPQKYAECKTSMPIARLIEALPEEYGDRIKLLSPHYNKQISRLRANPNTYYNRMFYVSGYTLGAVIWRSCETTNQSWLDINPDTVNYLSMGNVADLMAMPYDFPLPDKKEWNLLCQNVPPCTAEGAIRYIGKALLS